MSNIRAVMLKNGAEFIAEVVEDDFDTNTVVLNNPVTIVQGNDGQARFAPWFAFAASRKFTFSVDQVLLLNQACADVVSGYQQAFGLIQTATEKKIIT